MATKHVMPRDYILMGAGLLLLGFGLVMVMSAGGAAAQGIWGDKYLFFKKQCLFALLGLAAMFTAARLPITFFHAMAYPFLALAMLLLAATLVPGLGSTVNGSSRWLSLGPFSLQPLELAKPALVIYLAYFYSSKEAQVKSFSVGFLPPVLMTGMLCALLLGQPDFGGAVMLAAILFLMSFVGGARISHLFLTVTPALVSGWFLIVNSPYRMERVAAFIDPFADKAHLGYQLVQSLYAFGSGGLTGQGLGAGKQKLLFLPEAHNDFIMAVVGEELGFIGVSVVFALVAVFLLRAFQAAQNISDKRNRLTACGMAFVLSIQFVLNMAVVLGAAPPKGAPMPFVSYGGSSLLMACFCTGILLNLSQYKKGVPKK
jgi:cell division protein FtsW